MNEVVQYFRQLLTRVTGEDVELRVELAERLGRVRMDPGQVEQILVNLAANARDAMLRGGTLTVRTSNTELDDAYCRFHAEATPGRYVLLEVADSGNGMTADIREHAFEPFFTTKQRGHGTGLGLATVYGITKQNGGCIEVYSEPGLGTVFKLYFPEVDAEAEHVALARPAELARGTERLVVVEDDPQIREVAVRLLLRLGYKVSAYPSGESASAALEYETEPIRLLITDVVMPGIKGNELALRLRRHWPRLKVLFTSGYMDTIVRHSGALEPNAEFLPKPYTLQSLASRVRRILDSPMVSDIEPLSDAQLGEVRPFQQSGRRE